MVEDSRVLVAGRERADRECGGWVFVVSKATLKAQPPGWIESFNLLYTGNEVPDSKRKISGRCVSKRWGRWR